MALASVRMKYLGSKFSDSQYGTGTWSTGEIKTISASQAVSIEADTTLAPNFIPYVDQFDTVQKGVAQMPLILDQGATSYGIANTGTIATNGTVTLGTALNTTYSGGIWLYFPASAVVGDSTGGWYWTVMSSSTVGVVYTTRAATTAVTGSNSAYTGVTSQVNLPFTVTIPGGSMGANGAVDFTTSCAINSTAGNKSFQASFGGTNLTINTFGSVSALNTRQVIANRNSASSQRLSSLVSASATGGYATIDTTADVSLQFKLTLAAATDTIVLESWTVFLLPSA